MLEVFTWIVVIMLLIAVGVITTLTLSLKGIKRLFTKNKSDGKDKSS